ncbi:unnamed protein product [Phytophthora fragariaefolia]|uniref:Unnamed protein product n=1 Tax=Phytophthora fragariaefolia TaxID=1490495 RepID=A0A9W7CXG1_9STRA|nr:unnamed protein product [Phytophthora fragariaefolia]
MTIDYRPVNKLTVPLAGAVPNLTVVVEAVRGSYGLGTFDSHKGFWQMPLHPRSREVFSFVTEDGVFTPTRVPHGASDSAVYFQAQMNEVLKEILFKNVLVWIDDGLLFAQTPGAFLDNLEQFFWILRQRRLKLNAKECKLFARRVKWYGKLIDGEGLSGVTLEWNDDEQAAFRRVLEMVSGSCKLVFPDKGATVNMFCDASLTGYSIVITQVHHWQDGLSIEQQSHELLVCRGGLFKNAQLNWSIVEKEGYPIVKACSDLDYMLIREKGFHIYCEHSNLIRLFSPATEVKQHVKGKLQRWVLKLASCRYVIHHIAGENNLWADIISRWGNTKYVLVLKDELTHYWELVAADSANRQTAVEALLDWHKRFGLPRMWMSDNGAPFKCEVMAELAERLNATHAFAPVYSPWINGTVERVNRGILQVLRVMLLENQLDTRNWVHLLPLIQANLNHCPVLSLGGCAPVELFTGLPAPSALDVVMVPEDKLPRTLPLDKAEFREAIEGLRRSLHGLHRVARDQREQRRTAVMTRSKGTICNFSEGDYVMWSRVDQRLQGGKLLVRWVGPFQVVKALPHSFVVRHLITGAEYDVHGSRLKHYHDKDLDVTAEIREHVSLQGIVLEVREIVGHRVNPASGELELHVAWRGLQDIENSWEPASSIQHDVPAVAELWAIAQDGYNLTSLLLKLGAYDGTWYRESLSRKCSTGVSSWGAVWSIVPDTETKDGVDDADDADAATRLTPTAQPTAGRTDRVNTTPT